MIALPTLTLASRENAVQRLKQLAEGDDSSMALPAETYGGNDMKFDEVTPDIGAPTSYQETMQRTLTVAFQRDCRHGAATRGQLLAHGFNAEVRAHYEAARVGFFSGID